MNSSKFRFTLDLHSTHSQYSIPVMLGDTSVTLLISITDGGTPYIMSDGCLAKLSVKRPDGSTFTETCMIRNNAIVEYHFEQNEDTCAMEGVHYCDVTLYAPDGARVGSPRFTMVVSEKVVRGDDIVLTDENKTAVDAIILAEVERGIAEGKRIAAETERVEAEKARVKAEAERVKASKDVVSYGARISRNEKRIANLVNGYDDNLFTTDATSAYLKKVPENALPYAEIESVGDEVTAVKSLGGNKVLSDEVIFTSIPKEEMTVTNLGGGKFQFDGYTSWQDQDFDWEKGEYNSYTFLSVPLKAGEYLFTYRSDVFNTDYTGNMDFVLNIGGSAADFGFVTIPYDTIAHLKVWAATGNEGQKGAVYAFEIVKYNAYATEIEVIEALDVPFGENNFIAVEPMGTLVFENANKDNVPSKVNYWLKGV